jgi:hypothetical protein
MARSTRSLLVFGLSIALAACGAGQDSGGVDGGRRADGAVGDGFTRLPDGRIVPVDDGGAMLDGNSSSMDVVNPGKDSGMTFVPPDGSTVDPDSGVITLPDGAMVLPDGGAVPGDGDGGSATGDGGTGCGATEVCDNGMDDNCDGRIDENCPCLPGATQRCYDGNPAQAGVGVCTWGMSTCAGSGEFGTWGPCEGAGHPQDVVCGGGMDYHCDGRIDEGCACTAGATRGCYSGPAGTDGVGLCHGGTQTCVLSGTTTDWGPCTDEVTPTAELCDGMDHDCDGAANSGCTCTVGTSRACYTGPAGPSGVGLCHDGTQRCVMNASGMGSMWGECTGEVTPTPDTCDGLDHTCTGMTGVGCTCVIGSTQPCYTGPGSTRNVGICHDGTQSCVAMGTSAGWSGTCAGQVTPNASEICGNMLDDNCNGTVDEGCGGMLTCPGDQAVDAGSPITLTAMATMIRGLSWTIVSAPTGGASTAMWSPAPPTSATEQFTPYIVGDYVIRVSGTDATGRAVSCMFTVTARPHGLRIQLTWDGPGDVDLHLHNGTTRTAWFTTDDVFYANRSAWGASLDFDNTSASGPENISMNAPVTGMSYTIGVHNYANAAGRTATIQVFCGSTSGTTPTQTFTSRPLAGTDFGNCTTNDFWKVATVVMTSPTSCTITPINTYSNSSQRCSNF